MTSSRSSGYIIRSWSATYYSVDTKAWVPGILCLSNKGIQFEIDKTINKVIHFNDVTKISKSLSLIKFSAITFSTQDGTVHWFATFQDRNEAFLVLQNFYQGFLFNSKCMGKTRPNLIAPEERTEQGRELLKLTAESEKALQNASNALSQQGDQLRGALYTMEDTQQDLKVVERITKGLTSWLGRWRMPHANKSEEFIVFKDNDIPNVLDVDALYSQIALGNFSPQKECVFRVAEEGLTLLDMRQKIIHHIKWSDVSAVKFITPWEVSVTQRCNRQSENCFNVLCSNMPRALSRIETFAREKIEYSDDPSSSQSGPASGFASTQHTVTSPRHQGLSSLRNVQSQNYGGDFKPPTGTQMEEDNPQKQGISEAEAQALSSMLSNLKDLALNVQREEDSQLETIGKLTDSVDRANSRLKKVEKNMKKV